MGEGAPKNLEGMASGVARGIAEEKRTELAKNALLLGFPYLFKVLRGEKIEPWSNYETIQNAGSSVIWATVALVAGVNPWIPVGILAFNLITAHLANAVNSKQS